MEEVEKLRALFRELQKKDVKHKLSDRNVVEVVLKLIYLKKIELIFSLNGREYITHAQLEREIQDSLIERGGRIAILELQPLLNVDLEHIERKVAEMVKNDQELHLVDGELVSKYYLDQIGEEINETLQDTGVVDLSDLAKRFALYSDFLKESINARIGKIIGGKLENGVLYTHAYVERYTARIRGLLSGVTRPTPVAQLQSKYDLQEELFHSIVSRLIAEGRLDGSLQGHKERAQYLPAIYNHTRQRWIEEYFSSNGYIDFKTVERMGIGDPRSYLSTRFPQAIAVRTHLLAPATVQQADEAMCESLQSTGWAEISPLLPFLASADAAATLDSCASLQQLVKSGEAMLMAENFAVSKALMDRALQMIEERYTETLRTSTPAAASATPAAAENTLSASPEPETGKKKRGGARGGKAEKSDVKGKKGGGDDVIDGDTVRELKKRFEGMDEDLLTALLEHLRGAVIDMKQRVNASVFVAAAGSQKSRHQAAQEEINTQYLSLLLYREGARELQLSSEENEMLERHLLRAIGVLVVNAMVQEQVVAHCLPTSENVTATNRTEITSKLPASAARSIDRLAKTLTGKSVDSFIEETDQTADALQIKLPSADKRQMRDALLAHREQLKTSLEAETNPPTALQLAVLLFFHRTKQRALHLPTKLISRALEVLHQLLPASSFAVLSSFSADVVELLRLRAEAQRGGGDQQREKQLETKLADALPALKAAVFAPETEEEQRAMRARENERKKSGKDEKEEVSGGGNSRRKGKPRGGQQETDEAPETKSETKGRKQKTKEKAVEAAAEDSASDQALSTASSSSSQDQGEENVEVEAPSSPNPAPAAAKGRRRRAQQ